MSQSLIALAVLFCAVELPNSCVGQSRNSKLDRAVQEKARMKQPRQTIATAPRIRIGIMAVEGQARHKAAREILQRKLASQIRTQSSNHAVALQDRDFGACDPEWVVKGTYPIELLAKAHSKFNVDQVVFIRVNQWHAFEPMELSVTFHVVDSGDARLLVSEDEHWSLQDPSVKEAYRQYVCERFGIEGNVDVYFRCPTYFCDFVAQQIAMMCQR